MAWRRRIEEMAMKIESGDIIGVSMAAAWRESRRQQWRNGMAAISNNGSSIMAAAWRGNSA